MYYNISDALRHGQSGGTILEVLPYGALDHYSKGVIATKQRVLQLILSSSCLSCGGPATIFAHHRAATYLLPFSDNLREEFLDAQWGSFCKHCAPRGREKLPLSTLLGREWTTTTGERVVFSLLKRSGRFAAFIPTLPPAQKEEVPLTLRR